MFPLAGAMGAGWWEQEPLMQMSLCSGCCCPAAQACHLSELLGWTMHLEKERCPYSFPSHVKYPSSAYKIGRIIYVFPNFMKLVLMQNDSIKFWHPQYYYSYIVIVFCIWKVLTIKACFTERKTDLKIHGCLMRAGEKSRHPDVQLGKAEELRALKMLSWKSPG